MNHLYYGDNLEVLRKYIKDESIDLCYIHMKSAAALATRQDDRTRKEFEKWASAVKTNNMNTIC